MAAYAIVLPKCVMIFHVNSANPRRPYISVLQIVLNLDAYDATVSYMQNSVRLTHCEEDASHSNIDTIVST